MLRRVGVVIPFALLLAEKLRHDRVETRRAFPFLMSMIQASVLLHQFQREQTPDGCVIATRDDYAVAAVLLAVPMNRLLGGGISEPARRFAERLRRWFEDQTFTTREAKTRETTSQSSVYGWLSELRSAGVVEQVSEAQGSRAAKWRLTGLDAGQDAARVLPTVEAVFDGT
jgi:hypothetical protein